VIDDSDPHMDAAIRLGAASGLTDKQIALDLDTTQGYVKYRRRVLGVKAGYEASYWTAVELDTLRSMIVGGHSVDEASKVLGRGFHACCLKLSKMGIRRPPREVEPKKPRLKLVTPTKIWCQQCDRGVWPAEASSCTSQWCSANTERAAA